ncbi:MAG: FxDxF family PEP-CTERM protein [Nitrosospira sp.]|nr:FxDxF family PEP-CTERM protein [Nitrosospira sp.]
MKKLAINTALCALLCISFAAKAALEDLGNGVIKDTDLNIEWLSDANYSKSSDYHTTGAMNWDAANTWASNLTFANNGDWRLPSVSEMEHLFYHELGGSGGSNITTSHNVYYNLFDNVQSQWYWTSDHNNNSQAVAFGMFNGGTYLTSNTTGFYAMAVSSVPEPETYAMLLAGLGLVSLVARRRKQIS